MDNICIDVSDLTFSYADGVKILDNFNVSLQKNSITAVIGSSGCGKSTFLRCLNRMHDLYEGCSYEGSVLFEGENILSAETDVKKLRCKIGMVFQKPVPFPGSIFDNAAYGLRLTNSTEDFIRQKVKESLEQAALLNEVENRMEKEASTLSIGQQQRLCIARALAIDPTVLLLDEATSALDPISTAEVEEVLVNLKKSMSIIFVTHNMEQARRVADYCIFMDKGRVIEEGSTAELFQNPKNILTKNYLKISSSS